MHDKIVKIKEQENWKQKEEERIKDKKKDEQKEGEDDKYSTFSVRSEARSVASENTKSI